MIIPWWQPDPAKSNAEQYRPISAKTFLSYYGPDNNCRACLWMDKVRVPLLIVTHNIVDTVATPEMAEQLRTGAVNAPFVDFVNVGDSGHFYTGFEQELIGSVADWLDKVRTAAPAATRLREATSPGSWPRSSCPHRSRSPRPRRLRYTHRAPRPRRLEPSRRAPPARPHTRQRS